MITWGEPKRITNLAKHGIDLAECESAFDAPMLSVEDTRDAYEEQRLHSFRWLKDRGGRVDLDRSRRWPSSDFLTSWNFVASPLQRSSRSVIAMRQPSLSCRVPCAGAPVIRHLRQ